MNTTRTLAIIAIGCFAAAALIAPAAFAQPAPPCCAVIGHPAARPTHFENARDAESHKLLATFGSLCEQHRRSERLALVAGAARVAEDVLLGGQGGLMYAVGDIARSMPGPTSMTVGKVCQTFDREVHKDTTEVPF